MDPEIGKKWQKRTFGKLTNGGTAFMVSELDSKNLTPNYQARSGTLNTRQAIEIAEIEQANFKNRARSYLPLRTEGSDQTPGAYSISYADTGLPRALDR